MACNCLFYYSHHAMIRSIKGIQFSRLEYDYYDGDDIIKLIVEICLDTVNYVFSPSINLNMFFIDSFGNFLIYRNSYTSLCCIWSKIFNGKWMGWFTKSHRYWCTISFIQGWRAHISAGIFYRNLTLKTCNILVFNW